MKSHFNWLFLLVVSIAVYLSFAMQGNYDKTLDGYPQISGYEVAQPFKPDSSFIQLDPIHWWSEKKQVFAVVDKGVTLELIGREFRCGRYAFSDPFDRSEIIRVLSPDWLTTDGKGRIPGELSGKIKCRSGEARFLAGRYEGEWIPRGLFKKNKPIVVYQLSWSP